MPLETSAAEVSGFRGLTVVRARRNDQTPQRATATPIVANAAAASDVTSGGAGSLGGISATAHMPAATMRPTTGGGMRSSKKRMKPLRPCPSRPGFDHELQFLPEVSARDLPTSSSREVDAREHRPTSE